MTDNKNQDVNLIESLVDIMGNSEDQSVEEVKTELEADGIDVNESVQRLMATVRRCSNEAKRKRLDLAKHSRLQRETQRPTLRDQIAQMSIDQIEHRFREIEEFTEGQLYVNFRDLESQSDDDKRALLEDMEIALERIESEKGADDK